MPFLELWMCTNLKFCILCHKNNIYLLCTCNCARQHTKSSLILTVVQDKWVLFPLYRCWSEAQRGLVTCLQIWAELILDVLPKVTQLGSVRVGNCTTSLIALPSKYTFCSLALIVKTSLNPLRDGYLISFNMVVTDSSRISSSKDM